MIRNARFSCRRPHPLLLLAVVVFVAGCDGQADPAMALSEVAAVLRDFSIEFGRQALAAILF